MESNMSVKHARLSWTCKIQYKTTAIPPIHITHTIQNCGKVTIKFDGFRILKLFAV